MVDDAAGVLLSIFFELLLEVVDKDGETTFSVSRRSNDGGGLVAGWPKLTRGEKQERRHCQARKQVRLGNGNTVEGFPFYSSTERNGHPNRLR
jgi:hypothetical protein